jgi:hypothetical protein
MAQKNITNIIFMGLCISVILFVTYYTYNIYIYNKYKVERFADITSSSSPPSSPPPSPSSPSPAMDEEEKELLDKIKSEYTIFANFHNKLCTVWTYITQRAQKASEGNDPNAPTEETLDEFISKEEQSNNIKLLHCTNNYPIPTEYDITTALDIIPETPDVYATTIAYSLQQIYKIEQNSTASMANSPIKPNCPQVQQSADNVVIEGFAAEGFAAEGFAAEGFAAADSDRLISATDCKFTADNNLECRFSLAADSSGNLPASPAIIELRKKQEQQISNRLVQFMTEEKTLSNSLDLLIKKVNCLKWVEDCFKKNLIPDLTVCSST